MPRARDPRRDQAKQIWLDSKGEIKLVDLAKQFEVTSSTIRKWKATDKWGNELKGSAPKQTKKSAPLKKQNKKIKKKAVDIEEPIIIKNGELNDNQQLFCMYYLERYNATKAYQQAYCCDYKTANASGSRLLAKDSIRKEIERLQELQAQSIMLSADSILQKYIDIAFADIGDYVEQVGDNYIIMKRLEETDTSLISEISNGANGVKIKLADKMKALAFLAKHRKLLGNSDLQHLKEEEQRMKNEQLKRELGGNTIKADPFDAMSVEQLEEYLSKLEGEE